MERKAAHASGLKAARAAGNIKAEVRAAKLRLQRAACKLAADDPQREELTKQVSEAEAAILRERIDVTSLSREPCLSVHGFLLLDFPSIFMYYTCI